MTPDTLFRRGPFIAGLSGLSYFGRGMCRLCSTLFIALALLVSPLTMVSGAAANMPPAAAHHGSASVGQHCAGDEMPVPDERPEHPSCAAACAALPALPPPSGAVPAALSAGHVAAPNPALIGFESEGETPPPRILQ